MDYKKISIHVPSWGTTAKANNKSNQTAISIHVPSWGTTRTTVTMNMSMTFQSTFPRGERQRVREDDEGIP